MVGRIFYNTKILEKSLDATWKRNQAISHNIANVDTPGYKKKEVSFEKELADAMAGYGFKGKRTRDRHIQIGNVAIDEINPRVIEVDSTKMRVDDNNVDIDTEMANLATNTIMHYAAVQKINGELHRLKNIINEGRR
ncbi:MAG: flagellar basal body rod protein FlgB [Clostridiales bacterium]|nr:flagellar basal body rod protein FlgB [Clostridiales bacterium]